MTKMDFQMKVNFSIRAKMTLMVAGMLILALLTATYLIRGLVYQNILEQKITIAEILTDSIVHDIKYDFHVLKRESVEQVIAKFTTYYRIIRRISVYDRNVMNIADSNPSELGRLTKDVDIIAAVTFAKPSIQITSSDRRNMGIRSIAPILQGSRIVGAVGVDISIQDIQLTLAAIDRRVVAIMVVIVLAASAILFILLRITILQRLNHLMSITRQISAGNYNIQVGDQSKDELGQLAQLFNQMTEDLKISKQEIDDYNRNLEDGIQEATAQLQKAYEDIKNAQSQLVLNEKMASLGVLIAGIAHEINSPIGAIHNVTRNLEQKVTALPRILKDFKKEPDILVDKMAACLEGLNTISNVPVQSPSFKEIRVIETLLREHGIDNYKNMVTVLVKLNFTDREKILMYMDCLRIPSFFALFESFGSIIQAANISNASSQKIAEIVRALKYYAYTDRDKVEATQINESIQTALILLRSRLRHGITVSTEFAQDLPEIMCTSEIHQLWTNFLNNACDAIEEMGADHQGEIFISTGRVNDYVVVTITDNGNGIPDDKKEKIFDPFFTTKDIGKGTGLGLSIVAGILKKHNGTARVESRRGHTQFEISLPVNRPPEIDLDRQIDYSTETEAAGTGVI